LYLNDIAMIAADTTRTQFYLQNLVKHNLYPKCVILLLNSSDQPLPGQISSRSENRIVSILEEKNIDYEVLFNDDINSSEAIKSIENRPESVFIFSGFGGVLLKEKVLNLGKRFLHVHGGYLPNYKGSTTNYYSMLEENIIGASSIFLTKDIDCGPILLRKKFKAPSDREKIDHFHDSKVRSEVLVETLKKYVEYGDWSFKFQDNQKGETYYIIHPVLKHLAILGN